MLTNAIYFNAKWQKEFKTFQTQEGPFTTRSGDVAHAKYMKQVNNYLYASDNERQVLLVPYRDEDFAAVFLLAREGKHKMVEEELNADNFAGLLDSIHFYHGARMSQLIVSSPEYIPVKPAEDHLWPEIKPFDEASLRVSKLHTLWIAQYGNPSGIPVIVLHGGPGGGCSPRDMRYFDPSFYRIVLFDQRGAGRSRPVAETNENTTAHLIADIEMLRAHLSISRWLVFGGSFGSALALAYGEAHPAHCLGFVLRGIFLGTKDEYLKLWNNMGDIYPEEFAEYVEFLPLVERNNLLQSYYDRLMSTDPVVFMPAARAFYKYDQHCATLIDKTRIAANLTNDNSVLALSRLFAHYSKHEFFFSPDQLMQNLNLISHLPAMIVHGRYDVICRVSSAFRLHKAWPNSKLTIVQDGGHASYEPGITKALVEACTQFKTWFA